MDTIKKALYFASKKHDGQYRKGCDIPYIAHPVLVAFNVQKYTDNKDTIAAALLHDVLEDCPSMSVDILRKEFGDNIARLVCEASFLNSKEYSTWKERKETQLVQINSASKEALIIVASDKLCNLKAYFDTLENDPELTRNIFKGTPEEYCWYYQAIAGILKNKMTEHAITKEYCETLNLCKNKKPVSYK